MSTAAGLLGIAGVRATWGSSPVDLDLSRPCLPDSGGCSVDDAVWVLGISKKAKANAQHSGHSILRPQTWLQKHHVELHL
jgi:hypothetical protein